MSIKSDDDGLGLVWGASSIAKEVNATERRTFYLLEKGILPAKKVGNRWVAQRAALRDFFTAEKEALE